NNPEVIVMAAQRRLNEALLIECKRLPFGKCLCGLAASTRSVVFYDCVNELHDVGFEGMEPHGHYCIPILSGATILGVLNLYVKHSHKREKSEEDFLIAVANTLAGIINRDKAEEMIRRSEEFISTIIDSMHDSILVIDAKDFKILKANHIFFKEYSLIPDEIIGKKTCHEVLYKQHSLCKENNIQCPIEDTLNDGDYASCEHIHIDKNGNEIYVECNTSPIRNNNGEITQVVYVLRNITERKQFEKRLKELAHYDSLTGLPNRALFYDHLKSAVAMSKRNKTSFALLYLDLDKFKIVNDSLGHDIGDILLKEVGEVFKEVVRETDTVARMGGDEFNIILTKIDKKEDAAYIADRIISLINKPFNIQGKICSIGTSIGICVYPYEKDSMEDDISNVVKRADIALYRAKEQGRNNYQFYTDIIGKFDALVEIVTIFARDNSSQGENEAWIKFLDKMKNDGLYCSQEITKSLEKILEAARRFYRVISIKEAHSTVCGNSAKLIRKTKGDWNASDLESFLSSLKEQGIVLNEKEIGHLIELLSTIKSLYLQFI
ncbi:MAG: diguanylate cyclase, partial [Nitrospirae bacterium]|nr:diguanylate cyclase [Nitrospirota bacterium]